MNGPASSEPSWIVESTWIPATVPIIATICCAAFATPRSSGSTVLATTVINEDAEPPNPIPDTTNATKTSASTSPDAANAKSPIETATMSVPATAARRSPTRAAT